MTVQELLKAAMRAAGIYDRFTTPTPEDIEDAKEAFNLMLESWSLDGLMVYAFTQESGALTAAQNEYTWGLTTGDINTVRPFELLSAFIRVSDMDYPVDIITEGQYRLIMSKSVQARPNKAFYKPEYTSSLGKLYLYPTPSEIETIYFNTKKPWTTVSSLTETIAFPPGYLEALKWSLAAALIAEWGIKPKMDVLGLATAATEKLRQVNARHEPAMLSMPGVRGGHYNIYSDESF